MDQFYVLATVVAIVATFFNAAWFLWHHELPLAAQREADNILKEARAEAYTIRTRALKLEEDVLLKLPKASIDGHHQAHQS
jgi:hypothetical protein